MRIEVLEKIEKKDLEKWQELWDKNPRANFFNSPNYFKAFFGAFDQRYKVAFVYDGNELAAVLPLVRSSKFGVKVWACPDRPQKFLDKSALLLKKQDPQLFDRIVKAVGDELGNLFLSDIEEILCDERSRHKRYFFQFESICPRTVVCRDPLEQMKSKQKREVRRRMRKYGNILDFSLVKIVSRDDLLQMQKIEKASHKQERGIALFDEEDAKKIYQSFIDNSPENCMIGYLSDGDKKIAHAFGFAYKRTFLCTHMAFDKDYSNIGAGKIIIFSLLKKLCELEFCTFDFSKGDNQVKRELMSSFPSQYNLFFSRNIFAIVWWRLVIKLKSIIKKAIK